MTDTVIDTDTEALDALTLLLQQEIAAIRRGDLAEVPHFAARKDALAQRLDAASPAIEAVLAADPNDTALRSRIAALQDLIRTDQALLDGMTQATGTMIAEIARIRARHGLGGVYGEKGQQLRSLPLLAERFDRSL